MAGFIVGLVSEKDIETLNEQLAGRTVKCVEARPGGVGINIITEDDGREPRPPEGHRCMTPRQIARRAARQSD